MKTRILCALICATALWGCSNSEETVAPQRQAKRERMPQLERAGAAAARRALAYDARSYERDSALLQIHAVVSGLRAKGMTAAADSYVTGAQAVLQSHK